MADIIFSKKVAAESVNITRPARQRVENLQNLLNGTENSDLPYLQTFSVGQHSGFNITLPSHAVGLILMEHNNGNFEVAVFYRNGMSHLAGVSSFSVSNQILSSRNLPNWTSGIILCNFDAINNLTLI